MSSRELAIAQAIIAAIALTGTVVLSALRVQVPDVLTNIDYSLAGALIGGAVARSSTSANK